MQKEPGKLVRFFCMGAFSWSRKLGNIDEVHCWIEGNTDRVGFDSLWWKGEPGDLAPERWHQKFLVVFRLYRPFLLVFLKEQYRNLLPFPKMDPYQYFYRRTLTLCLTSPAQVCIVHCLSIAINCNPVDPRYKSNNTQAWRFSRKLLIIFSLCYYFPLFSLCSFSWTKNYCLHNFQWPSYAQWKAECMEYLRTKYNTDND